MKELAEGLKKEMEGSELTETSKEEVEQRAAAVGLKLVFKDSWYRLMAKPGTMIGRMRVVFPIPVASAVSLKDIEKWLKENERRVVPRRY